MTMPRGRQGTAVLCHPPLMRHHPPHLRRAAFPSRSRGEGRGAQWGAEAWSLRSQGPAVSIGSRDGASVTLGGLLRPHSTWYRG